MAREGQEDFMPRKRTPKNTTSETTTPPETPTASPVETPPAPSSEELNPAELLRQATATAAAEPVRAEDPPEPQSFVEKVLRERQPGIVPDPFGIAGDPEAGVRLFENRRERLMVIKFEKKPGNDVLDRMKDAGFRWNPRDQVWVHPIHPEFARRIRIESERLYQDVRQMVRKEKGLQTSQEIPF
jgi:hypothetical protein